MIVTPDGKVMAGLGGDGADVRAYARALARLSTIGPETLRQTVLRIMAGRGETTIVRG